MEGRMDIAARITALFIFRLPALLSDVCVVYRTFQLPVLEPLTPARLHKMIGVTMACLHVALAVTSAVDNFAPGSTVASKTGKTVGGVDNDGRGGRRVAEYEDDDGGVGAVVVLDGDGGR